MSTGSIMRSSVARRFAAWGRELETSGHLLLAEWMFEQVTRRASPSSTAYYLLGRTQVRRGKLTAGKDSFAKGLRLKPDFYHCRVGFFNACRDEHWQAGRSRRGGRRITLGDPSAWTLAELHRLLADALPSVVWYEIAKFESEDMESSVMTTLSAMQQRMKGRAARVLGRQLSETRAVLDLVVDALLAREAAAGSRHENRRVIVTLRDHTQKVFRAFRDGDDLIGTHFEVIHDGRISFLPIDSLREIRFGRYGEFSNVTIHGWNGRALQAVMPSFYYGSRFSNLADLRRGNVTMFKELYRGLQVGVGRRVFRGRRQESDDTSTVAIHEIEALEFQA